MTGLNAYLWPRTRSFSCTSTSESGPETICFVNLVPRVFRSIHSVSLPKGRKAILIQEPSAIPCRYCSNLPSVRLEVRYPYLKSVGSDPTFPWWLSLCVVTHALTSRENLPFLAYDSSDHTLSPHSISGVYINPCVHPDPCSLLIGHGFVHPLLT